MRKRRFKQSLSLFCCLLLLVSTMTMNGIPTSAETYPGFPSVTRMAAAEGIVLLENPSYGENKENNEINKVLPITNGQTVSIFGVVQDYYYASGTGSGQAPTTEYIVTIADGLRNNPNVKVNEELAGIYKAWIRNNPFINNGGWSGNTSWGQTEMPMTDAIVSDAKAKSDAALIIIGRTAGEDHEAKEVKGSYLLTDAELDMMRKVYAKFDRVAVVLNTAHVMDMQWTDEFPNAAIVYGWQGGMEGGSATADVLTGDITPSGKLSDTIAETVDDYAAFGNHWVARNGELKYEEDIYVGYRYFETFAKEKVRYQFGYGLSYTEFETVTDEVSITDGGMTRDGQISVTATVTNKGPVKGKEVVQVYYGAPQGALGKPAKQLVAFAKTGVLYPGESQTITMTFNIKSMSSYDDSGASGHDSAYVLEGGDYDIYVGNDVRNCKIEETFKLNATIVTEQLQEAMAPTRALRRMKPGALNAETGNYALTYEDSPLRKTDLAKRIEDNLPEAVPMTTVKQHKLIDVYNEDATMDEFIAQFTPRDLVAITMGENGGNYVVSGVAGRFGGVTQSLRDMGIPSLSAADGPAGIRLGSIRTTALPISTMLSCTWNAELIEEVYEYWGKEMVINTLDTILGPGIDIHRIPLGGRNFEYYSEDPFLSGIMGRAAAKGIQSQGPSPTVKHMAVNNLEFERRNYNCLISERAIREIYLRGFEIAVKSGDLRSIMTSYNAINGTWAAAHYDMNTTILRGEWGFDGILMTDWWAQYSSDQAYYNEGHVDGNRGGHYGIIAQQDLYMKHNSTTAVESNLGGFNTLTEYNNGNLTLGELQRTARNLCNYILKSQALARQEGIEYKPYVQERPEWFTVTKDVPAGNPLISEITIGGKKVRDMLFSELTLEYKAFYNGSGQYPVVAAVGKGDTQVRVEQATAAKPAATIIATSGKEERIYKVIFTEEDGLEPIFEDYTYAYLSQIQIDGVPLSGFDEAIFNYDVGVLVDGLPTVTATPKDGVTYVVTPNEANKTVAVRCTSTDQANTYLLRFGKAPESDEFNETTLKSFWKVNTETANNAENPNNWSLTANPGSLRIIAERGSFWQHEDFMKNFFQQEAFGDWEATAKINMSKVPDTHYMSAGITTGQDNNNYIFLKYEYTSNSRLIALCKETNGTIATIGSLTTAQLNEIMGNQTEVYFKLKKIGNTYTGYVSPDGAEFTQLGSTSAVYAIPKFGITSSTGGATITNNPFHSDFDYVRFTEPTVASTKFDEWNTKLKVAEVEPATITSTLIPATCNDVDGGRHLTGSRYGAVIGFDVDVEKDGAYMLLSRLRATNSNPLAQMSFSVFAGDKLLGEFAYINDTGGRWITMSNSDYIPLTAGKYRLRIVFNTNGLDLNWLQFQRKQDNVNTDALNALVQQAEGIDLNNYSAMKRADFELVLNEAKAILAKPVNAVVVAEAVTDLTAAITKLETRILPIDVEAKTEAIEGGLRIQAKDMPWAYVASTQFYLDSALGYTNYTTTNDILYFGKVDLTDLKAIRVNFASANSNHDLRFFTTALEGGQITQHAVSGYAGGVYRNGSIERKNELANIKFSQAGGVWESFATAGTDQIESDNSQVVLTYQGGGNDNYVNASEAEGEKNLYMLLEADSSVNIQHIDLIYDNGILPASKVSLEKSEETNELIANFSISNPSDETLEARCMVVTYDEKSILKKIEQKTVSVDANSVVKDKMTLPLKNEHTKVFLWNAKTNVPLCTATETTDDWFRYSENLALNRTVRSTNEQTDNWCRNAVDADRTTRWAANSGGYPRWIEVDLGEECELDKISLYWFVSGTRAYQYRLWGRTEPITDWNQPYATSKNFTTDSNYFLLSDNRSNATPVYTSNNLAGQKARYVVVEVTGATGGSGSASIFSIEIAGKR